MGIQEDARFSDVEVELERLEVMPLAQLRTFWSSRWGLPPRFRSPDMLRRLIAWRLQAEIFGGLDKATQGLLRSSKPMQAPSPPPGTRVTREYGGELHHVDIGEDAFIYRGASYKSLAAVARTITGTRWNGPRFFGLRDAASTP